MLLTPYLNMHLRDKFAFLGPGGVDIAITEFERFATLSLNSQGIFFPCTQLVDDVWHAAILETMDYFEFCNNIAPGKFLHHTGIEHHQYMLGRTVTQQDEEDLSVLVSYVTNFGPFTAASVSLWVIADQLLKSQGWTLAQLNAFLAGLAGQTSSDFPVGSGISTKDLILKFHKDTAGTTEAYFANRSTSRPALNTYEVLVAACEGLKSVTKPRILDIGCGIGTLFKPLAKRFSAVEYVGIDNSPDEISIGRSTIRSTDATLICTDAYQMPLRDNYFDAIVSHMTLHLLDRSDELFIELVRVLKPGGRLYFVVPARISETPGELAYTDTIALFKKFESADQLTGKPSIYHDQGTLIEGLREFFGGECSKVEEYQLQVNPLASDALDHFTGLYPYAMLRPKERKIYDSLASTFIKSFAIANPHLTLDRRLAVYMATKG